MNMHKFIILFKYCSINIMVLTFVLSGLTFK